MSELPPRYLENTGRARSLIRQKYCQYTRVRVKDLSFLVAGQALSPYFPTDLQWMPDCVTSNSHVRFFSLGPQQTVEAPIFCNVLFGAALIGYFVVLPCRALAPIEKIREEIVWINKAVDPTKCSCFHRGCCADTKHTPGTRTRPVKSATVDLSPRIFLRPFREYQWGDGRYLQGRGFQ